MRSQWRILNASERRDHCYLSAEDDCRYLWEYRPGRWRDPTHRLIADFKCPPTLAGIDPRRCEAKLAAIERIASALRSACTPAEIESVTWVPIPPSAAAGEGGYDDRLSQALRRAFGAGPLDLRELLTLSRSIPPDHASATRLSVGQLQSLLRLDAGALARAPPRARIALFDDLLTSGKHFRCCERRLRAALPGVPISGRFLARRALSTRWRGETRLPAARGHYAK